MLHFVRQYCESVRRKVSVSTDFLFFLAIAVLFIPANWLGAWILALTVHELFHYIALKICGGTIIGVRIDRRGVIMEAQPMSLGKEAFCAYAGPVGALIILPFARYVPRTAICTLVFSAYNLLPIFPLDGGRGLCCLLMKFLSNQLATRVMRYLENVLLLGILIIAIYSVFQLGLGLLPAILAVFLFCRCKGLKIPCKNRRLGLQ